MNRPTNNCAEVLQKTAEKLYPQIEKWLINGGEDKEEIDKDQTIKDIIDAISFYRNGYNSAKDFERFGYEGDTELVNIFECVTFTQYAIYAELINQWVKENNIKPELTIGDKCKFKISLGECVGEIKDIKPERAQYLISSKDIINMKSIFVDYELVTKLT